MAILRLYDDLARLWPLWGHPAGYEARCRHVRSLIERHSYLEARALLNMGHVGGKNAFQLKEHCEVTGIYNCQTLLGRAISAGG